MFNKSFEKRFAKWENKKRVELGNKVFLEKYTKFYVKQIKQIKNSKLLLLLCIIISFACAIIFLTAHIWDIGYGYPGDWNLIFSIALFILGVLSLLTGITLYTHRFAFWAAKVEQWNEEI